MRDNIDSCLGERSVGVSLLSSISCKAYVGNPCISPSLVPSVQNAVICTYRTLLSSQRKVLITATWSRTHMGQGLSMSFSSDPTAAFRLNSNGSRLSKKKGKQMIESKNTRIEVFWDFSNATYEEGPEPIDGFYILVVINSEKALLLGDGPSLLKPPQSRFSLVSRTEHFSGNTLYSTRARFGDTGPVHKVVIKYIGDHEGDGGQRLQVWMDGKVVVRVRRLRWNFRGNQTIFMDGMLVDMMWDVHDWFYNPGMGFAVFMFRTRSGLDSRLWLEEKMVGRDEDRGEFSLSIHASKSP